MNTDAPAASGNRPDPSVGSGRARSGITSGTTRARKYGSAAFFGLIAGLAVGGLNLWTAANGGVFEVFFDIFDSPVLLFMRTVRERFDFLAEVRPRLYYVYSFIAVICFWAVIGMLLAKLFCLRRAGKNR